MNLYYEKMKRLKVGEVIDLGSGYKWDNNIARALRSTQEFVTDNKPIIEVLMAGYSVLTELGKTVIEKEPTDAQS